jgi:CheY-like chemotaxis protein
VLQQPFVSVNTDRGTRVPGIASGGRAPHPGCVKISQTTDSSHPTVDGAKPWHERNHCTASQRIGRKSVLIADDDPDARASLGELLELAGHCVHTCGDGREAIRVACEVRPDVVFLDIEMPGLSGYAVCSQLRALDGFERTRVYALSGLTGPAHERRCRQEGFNGQLVKPVDISALDRLV